MKIEMAIIEAKFNLKSKLPRAEREYVDDLVRVAEDLGWRKRWSSGLRAGVAGTISVLLLLAAIVAAVW